MRAAMLEGLKQCAANVGADITLTQGAGGNISCKIGDQLWVKASGTWLQHACSENILVSVSQSSLKKDYYSHQVKGMAHYQTAGSNLRPSIETLLHAVIEKRFVLHVHAIDVLAYAVQESGEAMLAQLFADEDFAWCWIPYAKPGYELAQKLTVAGHHIDKGVFILQNHGLIVAADELAEMEVLLARVVTCCQRAPRETVKPVGENSGETMVGQMVRSVDPILMPLAHDEAALSTLQQGILYPDQVVFLGQANPVVDMVRQYQSYCVVPQQGVYVSQSITPGAMAMLRGHALLMQKLDNNAMLTQLSAGQVAELVDWDAEKYRQSLEVTGG